MGYRVLPPRSPRNLFSIDVAHAEENVFAEHAQYPLTQTEAGQNLLPPWFQRDDLGAEENDSPYPGIFSEYVHFMETTVEKAREEYLAECANAPKPLPVPSTDAVPSVDPQVEPSSAPSTAPVKPYVYSGWQAPIDYVSPFPPPPENVRDQ